MEHFAEHETSRTGDRTKMMVMTALFVALGYVATTVLMIPSPTGGYLNLGDTVVLLGAYLLGPVYGAIAAGLGPALADLLSGYGIYVPATLVIKSLMGLTAAFLYQKLGKRTWSLVVCGVAAEAIMVVGYCLYDGFLAGTITAGLVGIPSNLAQALFGIVASTLLTLGLRRSGSVRRECPRL